MSKFSEKLDDAIVASGLTEDDLAKESGFSRGYIAQTRNGQRVPKDNKKMEKLLKALRLTPYEYDELWREYSKNQVGVDVYERNETMIDLIESFGKVSGTFFGVEFNHQVPDVNVIDNSVDLDYIIKAVMEAESVKENGFINIVMQADQESTIRTLLNIIKNNKNQTKIQHILCLEKGYEKELLYNVETLKKLIPVAMADKTKNYEIYYYYDILSSHVNSCSVTPYFIVTSEYVLCMSYNMTMGILHKEEKIRLFYQQIFDEIKSKSTVLMKVLNYPVDMLMEYSVLSEMTQRIYTIGIQPCMGIAGMGTYLKKYCKIQDPKLLMLIKKRIVANEDIFKEGKARVISYYTKSGITAFMKEGVIAELPSGIYRKIEPIDRIGFFQGIITKIEEGAYETYLIDDKKIRVPKELYISSADDDSKTGLFYISEEDGVQIVLNEKTLTKLMNEFLKGLKNSDKVSSKEESEQYLRFLFNELKEEYGQS